MCKIVIYKLILWVSLVCLKASRQFYTYQENVKIWAAAFKKALKMEFRAEIKSIFYLTSQSTSNYSLR